MALPGIPYEGNARLVFHESKFSFSRACAVAEIGEGVASDWVRSGFALTRASERLPRSNAVAKMCVVRELLTADVPLGRAIEISDLVARMVMFYALRSSPELMIVRQSDGLVYRRVRSIIGSDETYLVKILGSPLGRFAAITEAKAAVFGDEFCDADHRSHVLLDLEGVGLRMAALSGPLMTLAILQKRRRADDWPIAYVS